MQRETTVKQAKTGGPSGARSRDLRIKRPESTAPLQPVNSSTEITRVFFREPRLNQGPPWPRKNRRPTLVFWKAEPISWGQS